MELIVGIDASRSRSGGAMRHVIGLLDAADPRRFGISQVHVWAFDELADALPDAEWLVVHRPAQLRGSLLQKAWWQWRSLPEELRACGAGIVLNTGTGTLCRTHPAVTMSQDMVPFEPGEIRRLYPSRAWVRAFVLKYVQRASLRRADGVIFLTPYASEAIQRAVGGLRRVTIIPHGVSSDFRQPLGIYRTAGSTLRCVYVSPTDAYKHQWHVVRAIAELRKRGYDLRLTLVGGKGGAHDRLEREMAISDPSGAFVIQTGFVSPDQIPSLLSDADLFVFASSCESMPNVLLEGMASGLPIACSDRGPMPQVLRDGGVYFDPEDPQSITAALERLIGDDELREAFGRRAAELSHEYSWERCAEATWTFLRQTALAYTSRSPASVTAGLSGGRQA